MKGYIKISTTDNEGEISVHTELEHVGIADKAILLDAFMKGLELGDMEVIALMAFLKANRESLEASKDEAAEFVKEEPDEHKVVIDINVNQ